MNEEFLVSARMVSSRLPTNYKISLAPQDLIEMQRHRVELAPLSDNNRDPLFFQTVLRCRVCRVVFYTLRDVQIHCSSFDHKRELYKQEIREEEALLDCSVSECSMVVSESEIRELNIDCCTVPGVEDLTVLEHVRCEIRPLKFPDVQEIFDRCQPVKYMICELCEVCVSDMNKFFLHLTGFGHTNRRNTLVELGKCYFQAFRDPSTLQKFFWEVRDNTLHDSLNDFHSRAWCGYSRVAEVSDLERGILREFIESVS